jgi:hypothetical protein
MYQKKKTLANLGHSQCKISLHGFQVICHLECIELMNGAKTLTVKFYFSVSYVTIALKCFIKVTNGSR